MSQFSKRYPNQQGNSDLNSQWLEGEHKMNHGLRYIYRAIRLVSGLVFAVAAIARADVPISPVAEVAGAKELAQLENEHVQVSFVEAKRGGKASARPVVRVRRGQEWVEAPLDASAESYQVVTAPGNVTFGMPEPRGYYALWSQEGRKGPLARVAWNAGKTEEAIVKSVSQLDAGRLKLKFYPLSTGSLEAIWSLAPDQKSIKVALEFRPLQEGQYSLGYFLFHRKPPEEVDELLLPPDDPGQAFSLEALHLSAGPGADSDVADAGGPDDLDRGGRSRIPHRSSSQCRRRSRVRAADSRRSRERTSLHLRPASREAGIQGGKGRSRAVHLSGVGAIRAIGTPPIGPLRTRCSAGTTTERMARSRSPRPR